MLVQIAKSLQQKWNKKSQKSLELCKVFVLCVCVRWRQPKHKISERCVFYVRLQRTQYLHLHNRQSVKINKHITWLFQFCFGAKDSCAWCRHHWRLYYIASAWHRFIGYWRNLARYMLTLWSISLSWQTFSPYHFGVCSLFSKNDIVSTCSTIIPFDCYIWPQDEHNLIAKLTIISLALCCHFFHHFLFAFKEKSITSDPITRWIINRLNFHHAVWLIS